jgi:hypothetical protein
MVRRNHRATVYLCWIRSRDLIWLAQQQEHRECATPNSAAVALFAALSGLYLRVTKLRIAHLRTGMIRFVNRDAKSYFVHFSSRRTARDSDL